jgi:hypothetical protein
MLKQYQRFLQTKSLFLKGVLLAACLWVVLPCALSQVPSFDDDNGTTFRLNASKSKNLPPAMYGTWSIHATVLESNAPYGTYQPSSSELWMLDKEDGVITLRNIITNAVASISVDRVVGNTATFHHVANVPDRGMRIVEMPTLTVSGDHLSGMNEQTVVFYRGGQFAAAYNLKIQIEGTRLAGAKVTFSDTQTQNPVPRFEVAPLQFKDR